MQELFLLFIVQDNSRSRKLLILETSGISVTVQYWDIIRHSMEHIESHV